MYRGNLPEEQSTINAAVPQQIPNLMPWPAGTTWSVANMPWNSGVGTDGNLVQFNAFQPQPHTSGYDGHAQLKRKADFEGPHQAKQFISEEKFSAHFNGLHISSNYIQNNLGENETFIRTDTQPAESYGKDFSNLTYRDYQNTAKALEQKLMKANRISVCEVVQKLHEEETKNALLSKMLPIEKAPCTDLVLWKPPAPPILEIIKNARHTAQEQETVRLAMGQNAQNPADVDDDEAFEDATGAFVDNNNSSATNFNNMLIDGMDTDL